MSDTKKQNQNENSNKQDIGGNEKKVNFLISQYETWSTAIDRIKQDEQRWITTLLVFFGAIFTFLISDFKGALLFDKGYENFIGLIIIDIVIHLVSFVWAHHSLILRLQYYRVILQTQKFKHSIDGEYNEFLDKNPRFEKWREEQTKPNESKIVDFWLLGGLYLVAGLLAIYRFMFPYLIKSNTCPQSHNFNCGIFIVIIVFVIVHIAGFFYFPKIYYPKKDRKNMLKVFDAI